MMAGCKQVHPGADLEPASLLGLIESERVTICAAVPTIWVGMLEELDRKSYDLSSVRCLVSGGAPLAPSVMEAFEQRHGVSMVQGWGMTETSPVCAHGHLKSGYKEATPEQQLAARSKTGFMIPGVEFRVVDDSGDEIAWDGITYGELQVRGPWVASSYYNDERSNDSFVDGWLKTGDVVTVDKQGYFMIVDRIKDLVKSGGEWISSVELEKAIMGHPAVKEAAVIGIPHPRWTERPLACVVVRMGAELHQDELIEHLRPLVPSWWLPDDVVFIDEVPKTSVGKFDKLALRARFVKRSLTR
ncbi:MAG: AMP-binding protein, partial [Actinomycetota bacterium]